MSDIAGPPRLPTPTRRSGGGVPQEALKSKSPRHSTAAGDDPVKKEPGEGGGSAEAVRTRPAALASAPISQLRQNRVRINVRLPVELVGALESLGSGARASFLMDAYHRHASAVSSHQVQPPGAAGTTRMWGARVSPAFRARLLNLASDREWTLSTLLRVLIALEVDHSRRDDD